MRVSEPRPIYLIRIMSDRENPQEEPVVIDDEPDNLPVDLNEAVTPPESDEELDHTGKQIANVIMYAPALVLEFINWAA